VITITCRGADVLPLDAIEEFQGKLKKRTKRDIHKIITSIKKYGFTFPFFIWNGTGHNYCLDGHGRILALNSMRESGEELPLFPVIYIEAADEAEAKQKLLRIDSRYGRITQSGFDEFTDGLEINLEELSLPEINLDEDFVEEGEDELPGLDWENPISKPGEVYHLGDHTLICGDSTVLSNFTGIKAHICFTSPPYNSGDAKAAKKSIFGKGDCTSMYINNKDSIEPVLYRETMWTILNNIRSALENPHAVFWNVSYNKNSRDDYGKIVFSERNPFHVYETIVWEKSSSIPSVVKSCLQRRCELIFLMAADFPYRENTTKKVRFNHWKVNNANCQHEIHRGCFPVGLPEKAIVEYTEPGNVVLDPFGGTGTTLIACEKTGRTGVLLEIEPIYCDIIRRRYGVFAKKPKGDYL
jgi:DNA modification methylase